MGILVNWIYSFALAIGLVIGFWGGLRPLAAEFPLVVGSIWAAYALGVSAIIFLFSLPFRRRFVLRLQVEAFIFALFLLLLSDIPGRSFGFLIDERSRVLIPVFGVLFSAILIRAKHFQQLAKCGRVFGLGLLLVLQLVLCFSFLEYSAGRLLFSDDHPSFLYRLQLLKEHFPFIPFYNPDWNAGYLAREFFPSGVLNVFFVSMPLLWAFDFSSFAGSSSYTLLIPYLYIFIVPFSVYAAGRMLHLSRSASVFAAIFSLGPSTGYFEWLLKYGTLGFCFSCGLLPLCFALIYRLGLDVRKPQKGHVLALLAVSFCVLSWTLSFIALIPIALFSVWRIDRVFSRERRLLIFSFLAAFILINAPWIIVFLRESHVFDFLKGQTMPGSTTRLISSPTVQSNEFSLVLLEGIKHLRPLISKVNPLLLLMFVPGFSLIRRRYLGKALFVTVLWLLFVACVGDLYKPQLELKRMVIAASMFMCLGAGASLSFLFRRLLKSATPVFASSFSVKQVVSLFLISVLGGYAIYSPFAVSSAYLNRSDERYIFAPDLVGSLSNAIGEHTGDGRVMFSGFILHELGAKNYSSQDGGHVAPLAIWSGKQLYASHFYHARWSSVDPVPEVYRKRGAQGIEEFFDLLNISTVVTYKSEWRDYCRNTKGYEEVFHEGRFRVFKRKGPSEGYFLEGAGEVEVQKNGLRIKPATQRVVLKYRSLDGLVLKPKGAATLFSQYVYDEELGDGEVDKVSFIGLEFSEDFRDRVVELRYRAW